jgi:hypothetical protein
MLETMYPHMNRPVTMVLALISSRSSMTGGNEGTRYTPGALMYTPQPHSERSLVSRSSYEMLVDVEQAVPLSL